MEGADRPRRQPRRGRLSREGAASRRPGRGRAADLAGRRGRVAQRRPGARRGLEAAHGVRRLPASARRPAPDGRAEGQAFASTARAWIPVSSVSSAGDLAATWGGGAGGPAAGCASGAGPAAEDAPGLGWQLAVDLACPPPGPPNRWLRQRRRQSRAARRRLVALDIPLAAAVVPADHRGQVLLLRWIPPVTSAFMVGAPVRCAAAARLGIPTALSLAQTAAEFRSNLPIALVAAEDQTFPDAPRLRLQGHRQGAEQQPARPQGARRQHHQPAGRQEPVPLERAQLLPQGAGSLVHGADRSASGPSRASSRSTPTSPNSAMACMAPKRRRRPTSTSRRRD